MKEASPFAGAHRHVHVCLVSDQPIPNLTTILQLRPDVVVLLFTEGMLRQKHRLIPLVRAHGIKTRDIKIQAFDMGNVMTACERLLDEHRDDEISLNITGGTKIGAIGAYQAFASKGRDIFYVDTADSVILRLFPREDRRPIAVEIGAREYLEAYGFRLKQSASGPTEVKAIERRAAVSNFLATLAAAAPDDIRAMNRQIGNLGQRPSRLLIDLEARDGLRALAGLAGIAWKSSTGASSSTSRAAGMRNSFSWLPGTCRRPRSCSTWRAPGTWPLMRSRPMSSTC